MMNASLALVRAGSWSAPLCNAIRQAGLTVEHVEDFTPDRADVLAWLIPFEALSTAEVMRLADELGSHNFRRPVVLLVEKRLGVAHLKLLEAGLSHLAPVSQGEPLFAEMFRGTLERLAGHADPGRSRLVPHRAQSHRVISSKDKGSIVAAVGALALAHGGSERAADALRTIVDELVTNALYNAPVDAQGQPRFAHLARAVPVTLSSHEMVSATVEVREQRVSIRVADPFGTLSPERVREAIARSMTLGTIERKSGGAGLGLAWVFNAACHLTVNITPFQLTEVVAMVDLSIKQRELSRAPRSFDLFVQRSLPKRTPTVFSFEESRT